LLAAARSWRAGLVNNTSTSLAGPTRQLVEAINEFERCDHPRPAWVFHPDGRTECSSCGTALPTSPAGP